MSSAQVAPGTTIETFTVSGLVRSRAGATTYDATDAQGQPAGITIYAAECFPSALVLERSLRELRQLQTIAHARVARVLGCGKFPGGGTWEAHAPLPTQSLAELLAGGALAEADALAIAAQVGDALIEAQKVGVIHRSLGADVVFPSPNGVVVTGFAVGAPQGGRSFGPLDTMAPEQVEGKVVDQRTLIYNLAALVHYMLRGATLFAGDAAAVLQAHLSKEPVGEIPAALRRGLAKDPRVRPMMLRQFVTEIAGGVGADPAAGMPTSRGWTMFMSEGQGAPAAVAAAVPAAVATAPAGSPAADAAQPSTRGWTMFTQAASDDAPAPTAAAPAPAPVAPVASSPVVPAVPAAGAKPSTRGWTMFMEAAEEPSPSAAAVVPVAAPAPTPAPTPVVAPSTGAPSSRGWTMFTSAAEDESAAPAPASAAASPAQPSGAPVSVAPAATAADASAPTTRGWTMFTRDEESPATAGAAAVTAAAPTPVEPVPDPTDTSSPSSRGWTMFMEPGAAAAAAAVAQPVVPSSTPTPAATSAADEPVGGQRRGWTMFMEAPIASAPQAQFGPSPAAESQPPAPAEAEPPSADSRGWTVFGAPAPGAPPAESNPSVAHDASEGPTASGQVTSTAAPDPAPGRGRTVVAVGVPAVPGSVGGVTGRTVFPSTTPAMPDTQYSRRGDIPVERPASRTTAVDVPAPPGRAPAEERDAGSRSSIPVRAEPNLPERSGGSKTVMFVVVIVAAVGAIVALVAYLT